MKLQYDYDMAHLTYTPHELTNAYRTYMMYAHDGYQLKDMIKLKKGQKYTSGQIVSSNIKLVKNSYPARDVRSLRLTKIIGTRKKQTYRRKMSAFGMYMFLNHPDKLLKFNNGQELTDLAKKQLEAQQVYKNKQLASQQQKVEAQVVPHTADSQTA